MELDMDLEYAELNRVWTTEEYMEAGMKPGEIGGGQTHRLERFVALALLNSGRSIIRARQCNCGGLFKNRYRSRSENGEEIWVSCVHVKLPDDLIMLIL